MLKLYYSPGSCALASHIALEESGVAYTADQQPRIRFNGKTAQRARQVTRTQFGCSAGATRERGELEQLVACLGRPVQICAH